MSASLAYSHALLRLLSRTVDDAYSMQAVLGAVSPGVESMVVSRSCENAARDAGMTVPSFEAALGRAEHQGLIEGLVIADGCVSFRMP